MHRFRNVLVVTDGGLSASQDVVACAVRLAKQEGAALKLVAVVETPRWYARLLHSSTDELQARIVREQAETLTQLAEPARQAGVAVSTEVLQGRRDFELIREAGKKYDLLMKQAEPNESVLFGSTDMQLLRACPCPVWLVKPGRGDRPIAKILATVDPAPPPDEADLLNIKAGYAPKDAALDRKVLELAGSLAGDSGAELHVLHAWTAPGEGALRGDSLLTQEQVDRYVEDSRAEARKALDDLVASLPEPTRPVVHLRKGDPADVIADFAKAEGVDLVVMGTVARTGIPGLLIGSTAEAILQRVDCSVLAVKPQGFVSPVDAGG